MSNVYAQIGSGFQQIGGDCPDGFIEMQYERPDNNSVAAADGAWVAAPIPIPQSVTRAQGKAALITAGLWAGVVAFVDAIEDPTEQALARVALDDTTEWRRDSPFLATAAGALGLTDEQLDDLFIAAAQIVL